MPIATVAVLNEGALIDSTWFDAIRDSLNNVWKPARVNFVSVGAGQTTSSTSYADVPTVTTTFTPLADPASNTRVYVHATLALNADANRLGWLTINHNGSDVAAFAIALRTTTRNYNITTSFVAGAVDVAKTLKIRWRVDSAGTLTLTNGHGNYIRAIEY